MCKIQTLIINLADCYLFNKRHKLVLLYCYELTSAGKKYICLHLVLTQYIHTRVLLKANSKLFLK